MEREEMDLTKRSNQIKSLIICIIFAIVGVLFINSSLIKPAKKIKQTQSWDKTSCTIKSMDWKTSHSHTSSGSSTSSKMVVRYSYEYDGKKYWSSNYRYGRGKYSKGMIFQPGQKTYCFVNPDDPSEAVMIRDDSVWHWMMLLPVFFVVIGIAGVINSIRYMLYYTEN